MSEDNFGYGSSGGVQRQFLSLGSGVQSLDEASRSVSPRDLPVSPPTSAEIPNMQHHFVVGEWLGSNSDPHACTQHFTDGAVSSAFELAYSHFVTACGVRKTAPYRHTLCMRIHRSV